MDRTKVILYLDAVGTSSTVALFNPAGVLVDRLEWPQKKNQTEKLLREIDRLLCKNVLSKQNLSAIYANPDSGSFTGVRISLTVANFLAFGLDIPIAGASMPEVEKAIKKDAAAQAVFPLLPRYDRWPRLKIKK